MAGRGAGPVAALLAIALVAAAHEPAAHAQGVPEVGEVKCAGSVTCQCNGQLSDHEGCDFDCEAWCLGQSSGSGGGASGPGAGPRGPGLLDLIAKAFTPPAPTPEQIAAAKEAARRRQQEVDQARAEHRASTQARLDREARGRDLLAAAAALRAALEAAGGKRSPKQYVRRLLAPLPKRSRAPVGALAQAHCAAFQGALALRMGVWHHAGVPSVDPVFLDAERIAGEARSPFDTGTAVAGCERFEVGADCQDRPATPAGNAVSGTPKAQAGQLVRVLMSMRPAADKLAEAEQASAAAQSKWRATREQALADQRRRRAALEELSRRYAEEERRYQELLARKQEQDKRGAWNNKLLELRIQLEKKLAEQGRARAGVLARLEEEKRQQEAQQRRERERLETLKELFGRAKQAVEGERSRIDAEEQRLRALQQGLRRAAGPGGGRCLTSRGGTP